MSEQASRRSVSREFSLFIDVLRIIAAFAVFFSHYASGRLSGGLFWQIMPYGHSAVIVFFVLSGFVIAFVSQEKERTAGDYAQSRFARIVSVSVPAILLTVILDMAGKAMAPQLYTPDWGFRDDWPALRFLLGGLFLSQNWMLDVTVFSNLPYWSLCYEVWYYAIFGAFFYLFGASRFWLAGLLSLIAGPKILLLMPIWLLGVAVYRYGKNVPQHFGWSLAAISFVAFVLLEGAGGQSLFSHASSPWLPPEFSPYDYILGIIVGLNLLGMSRVHHIPGLRRFERPIRWAAGLTFSLYLFHFPLLQFVAAAVPGNASGGIHRIAVLVIPLLVVAGLGSLTENKRHLLKAWIAKFPPFRNPGNALPRFPDLATELHSKDSVI